MSFLRICVIYMMLGQLPLTLYGDFGGFDYGQMFLLGPQRDAATAARTGFLCASVPDVPDGTPRAFPSSADRTCPSHAKFRVRGGGGIGNGFSDDCAARQRTLDATASCLAGIRGCQLPDGAFAQVAPGGNASAPVWVAPYFANFAALALLAGHRHMPHPEDLVRVSRWLEWCAGHQASGGYWTDFEGTSASYSDTGKVDAWDSSAALFLSVLAGYRRAGGEVQSAWFDAARRASACLETLTDKDGLTWAKPDYRVKFLMDNIEVCVGWRSAAEIFAAAGAAADAGRARSHADRLISFSLPGYWQSGTGRFSHARLADGTLAPVGAKSYPYGLAQLYGIAFVHPYGAAWLSVNRAYHPNTGASAAFGPEWWLVAASVVSEDDARLWRPRVCEAVAAFDPARTYLHRYALSALALLDGAQWLQSNNVP